MTGYWDSLMLLDPLLMPLWSGVLTQPVTANAMTTRIKNIIFIKVNAGFSFGALTAIARAVK